MNFWFKTSPRTLQINWWRGIRLRQIFNYHLLTFISGHWEELLIAWLRPQRKWPSGLRSACHPYPKDWWIFSWCWWRNCCHHKKRERKIQENSVSLALITVWLIMVIELSGVQFGLKSYAWFQNWTSAQREFDLKSQVWFQTKIAGHEVQLPLYYIHFEIAKFSQY